MSYYNTFMTTNKTSPAQRWRDGLQELVNQEFENASTYKENAIEEETAFGTLQFETIEARLTTLVDAKTGQRVNDDYRKLIFKDLTYTPFFGTRYRIANNIWIIYSTDNLLTDTSSAYIRRCNNTINTQDAFGNIHEEPCYIDYKVTETQLYHGDILDTPQGRIWVQCQLNDWTKNIDVGFRFMVGGDAYKVRNRSKYDRRETLSNDSRYVLSFYADYDNRGKDDNIELEVANYKDYNYQIQCIDSISNIIGYSNNLNCSVILDGQIVDTSLLYTSSDTNIVTVSSTGAYTLVSVGTASITVTMEKNTSITKVIPVNCVSQPENIYQTLMTPDNLTVPVNTTRVYSIYEYLNNVVQDTTFTFSVSGAPQTYYTFASTGNTFTVTTLKSSNKYILRVDFVNNRSGYSTKNYTGASGEDKPILIELGGIQ